MKQLADARTTPVKDIIYMLEKHNAWITRYCGTHILINFSLNFFNTAQVMYVFYKQFIFMNFFWVVYDELYCFAWRWFFLNVYLLKYVPFVLKICDCIHSYVHHIKIYRIKRLMIILFL